MCSTCKNAKCKMEWITIIFSYSIAEYEKVETINGNKRMKATISNYKQPRKDFMKLWREQMVTFKPHHDHVEWHKKQLDLLFKKFSKNVLISR